MNSAELYFLLPFWCSVAGALALLFNEAFYRESGRKFVSIISFIFSLAAFAYIIILWSQVAEPRALFNRTIVIDQFSLGIAAIGLMSAVITFLFAHKYLIHERAVTGEFYALILLALSGIQILSSAREMMTFFIGLELLSIPGYVLAGYFRNRERSMEAALKYYLPGVFATALVLYGMALLYGVAGSTYFEVISARLAQGNIPITAYAGGILILAALAFKIGLVPFHAWAPDVYDGAAAPITAFLATGFKAAGFAALARVFITLVPVSIHWADVFIVISILTMTVGNFGALMQKSVKKMLAFSSVAHAGYLLVTFTVIGLVPASEIYRTIFIYMAAYTLMTGGAFGLLSWLSGEKESKANFEDMTGLGLKYPLAGVAMTVFMFSLAGFPPSGGFFGKYVVFKLAVANGLTWVAIVGVLNSFLSAYYYLRVIVYLYMKPSSNESTLRESGKTFKIALVFTICGCLTGGIISMLVW